MHSKAKPNQMATFEFYELPAEVKQSIFEFNKPRYIYDDLVRKFKYDLLVKSFNQEIEEIIEEAEENQEWDDIQEGGLMGVITCENFGIHSHFLSAPDGFPTYMGLSKLLAETIEDRGSRNARADSDWARAVGWQPHLEV